MNRVSGTYNVPVLGIPRLRSRALEPTPARRARDGRVDLLAWPSLNRMMLIRASDRWVVKTDSGVAVPEK